MTNEEKLLAKAAIGANAILAAGGVLAIFVWLYFIYHYTWTGQREFNSTFGMVAYFAFPPIAATFFFAALRWKPAHKVNLAILCLALTGSLYMGELFLTPWVQETSMQKYLNAKAKTARQFGIDFDSRSWFEIVADLHKKDIDAVPAVSHFWRDDEDGSVKSLVRINGDEIIAFGGIANKTTVFCNENGRPTIYDSDEHGFHNPTGLWKADRVDIVALGDSFTHGACVPSDKNFVALIRKRYPATLNLGRKGMGPLTELATFKEYASRVRPKVLLWFYFEKNDLVPDLATEKKSRLLMRYLDDNFTQGLFDRQTDVDRAIMNLLIIKIAEEKIKESERARRNNGLVTDINRLVDIIKLSTIRNKAGLVYGKDSVGEASSSKDESPIADIALFRKILLQVKTAVGSWGGSLYFVYLPEWERYARPKPVTKTRELVLQLVKTLNLNIIDLHPTFQGQKDPLLLFPFREDGHYNEQGHRVVAEAVLRSISLNSERLH